MSILMYEAARRASVIAEYALAQQTVATEHLNIQTNLHNASFGHDVLMELQRTPRRSTTASRTTASAEVSSAAMSESVHSILDAPSEVFESDESSEIGEPGEQDELDDVDPPAYGNSFTVQDYVIVQERPPRKPKLPKIKIDFPKHTYDLGHLIIGQITITPQDEDMTIDDLTVSLISEERIHLVSQFADRFSLRRVLLDRSNNIEHPESDSTKFRVGKQYQMSFTLTIPHVLTTCRHENLPLHNNLPPTGPFVQYYVAFAYAQVPVRVSPSYNDITEYSRIYQAPFSRSKQLRHGLKKGAVVRLQADSVPVLEIGNDFRFPLSLYYHDDRRSTRPEVGFIASWLKVYRMYRVTATKESLTRYVSAKERGLDVIELNHRFYGNATDISWTKTDNVYVGQCMVDLGKVPAVLTPTYVSCVSSVQYKLELTVAFRGYLNRITLDIPVICQQCPTLNE